MIKAEVLIENKLWNSKQIKWPVFFNKIIKAFPSRYQFKNKNVNLSVLLADNKHIKKLNKKFRNKNKHTDILSFPFDKKLFKKKEIYLGDIIISYEYMNKLGSKKSFQFKQKVLRIFIHGFLHLLNYDHIKLKDFKKMDKEEKKIYSFVRKKVEKFI